MKVEQRRALRGRLNDVREMYKRMKRRSKKPFRLTVVDLAALTSIISEKGMDWRTFDVESLVDCTLSYDENKSKIEDVCRKGD